MQLTGVSENFKAPIGVIRDFVVPVRQGERSTGRSGEGVKAKLDQVSTFRTVAPFTRHRFSPSSFFAVSIFTVVHNGK